MQRVLYLMCFVMLSGPISGAELCVTEEPSKLGDLSTARRLLRQASSLAAEQGESQQFWTQRTLLQIGDVQIRACDFDGARKSILASTYPYGRRASMVRLADALAQHGEHDEALVVLSQAELRQGWRRSSAYAAVRLRLIDNLIAAGEFDRAKQAAEKLQSKRHRPVGFRKLAVGLAKAGKKSQSEQSFSNALDVTSDLDGYDRARAIWEIGEAQLSIGEQDAADATVLILANAAGKMEAWAKVAALREAAVLCAKLNDRPAANSYFRQAIEAHNAVDAVNKSNALSQVVEAQSRAGYFEDARKTLQTMGQGALGSADWSRIDDAVRAIAMAQLAANDVEGAYRTALDFSRYMQYRDSIVNAVVEFHIEKKNYAKGIEASAIIHNPSRRASAILKVAVALAKSGNAKRAGEVAARIKLNGQSFFTESAAFDYRRPTTWLTDYDSGNGLTGLSMLLARKRGAELSKWAMTLAQTLPIQPSPDYLRVFKQGADDSMIRELARAHAAIGDSSEALAWAQRIGSDKKVAEQDFRATWALTNRINALVGVAEGLLDRVGGARKSA